MNIVYEGEQCPSRGPALTHMRDDLGACRFCGGTVRPANAKPPEQMPPLDVAARMAQLGHLPKQAEMSVEDGVIVNLHEPRMITGRGPEGRAYGPGRSPDGKGGLTARDQAQLRFVQWRTKDMEP